MKTKLLLTAALIGAASLSAQAGVHFGFSFGLPLPPLPVVTVAAPVYVAPAPVCAPPAVACPATAVIVATPACPGPDYVWAPGYWSVSGPSRIWVGGCWQHRPAHVVFSEGPRGSSYAYVRDYDRGHDYDRNWNHGGDYDRERMKPCWRISPVKNSSANFNFVQARLKRKLHKRLPLIAATFFLLGRGIFVCPRCS